MKEAVFVSSFPSRPSFADKARNVCFWAIYVTLYSEIRTRHIVRAAAAESSITWPLSGRQPHRTTGSDIGLVATAKYVPPSQAHSLWCILVKRVSLSRILIACNFLTFGGRLGVPHIDTYLIYQSKLNKYPKQALRSNSSQVKSTL